MLIVSLILLVFCFFIWFRNFKVRSFMLGILDDIHILACHEVEKNSEWRWRYVEFEKVSYERILFSFWKPLKVEKFWKDISFLQS
jgi:hypothetical protein